MKRVWIVVCLIMACALLPFAAQAETIDGAIRVYLKSLGQKTSLDVTTEGEYSIDGDADKRFQSGAVMTITAYENQLYITCGMITLNVGQAFTLARHGNVGGLYISGSQRGLLYMGDLELTVKDGYIYPILVIGLEDYLLGVTPYEMSDSFPLEALKAQAVAARTYALRMRLSGDARGYDVVDTPADQVFMGYDPENGNAILACRETEGLVGMYNGQYATCFYTASNGGQTALPSDIWGGEGDYGYLTRRDDPYDVANPRSVVKSAKIGADGSGLTEEMLEALLGQACEPLSAMGYDEDSENMELLRITDMAVCDPAAEGSLCATSLVITYTMRARPLREEAAENAPAPAPGQTAEPPQYVLGDMEDVEGEFTASIPLFDVVKVGLGLKINSGDYELFSVTKNADETGEIQSFTVESRRYGHGVGMSQRGAQEMAGVYGMTCEEILSFYYPGMELILYDVRNQTRDVLPPLFGQKNDSLPELRTGEKYGRVKVTGVSTALNIRSQPTTQSDIVGLAYDGDGIIIMEAEKDGWYRVRNRQITGYAAAEYIQIE